MFHIMTMDESVEQFITCVEESVAVEDDIRWCPCIANSIGGGYSSTMRLKRAEMPILIFNVIYVSLFTALALRRANHEFLLYVAVIVVIASWILWKQHAIRFPRTILWGLSLWGFAHMAGGLLRVGAGVLYELILVPIVPHLNILRFDQLVHALGFGVATMIGHHLLRSYTIKGVRVGPGYWFVVALAGCGFGALNEVIEFVAVLTMPQTGVGGYENTLLDLVFNMIGVTLTTMWLAMSSRRDTRPMGEGTS